MCVIISETEPIINTWQAATGYMIFKKTKENFRIFEINLAFRKKRFFVYIEALTNTALDPVPVNLYYL